MDAFRLFVTSVIGLASHQWLTSNAGFVSSPVTLKISGGGGLIILTLQRLLKVMSHVRLQFLWNITITYDAK